MYLKRQTRGMLDTGSMRVILRVRRVNDGSTLLLEGSDGRTLVEHMENCAPCHLTNVDGTMVVA